MPETPEQDKPIAPRREAARGAMPGPRAMLRAIARRLGELVPWHHRSSAAREWRRTGNALAPLLEAPDGEGAAFSGRLGSIDAPLRREVESLLEAHRRPGPLDQPVLIAIAPEDTGGGRSQSWEGEAVVAH